ncbi:YfdX family protein [Sulfurovum sp. ST-21]|uniref:YfdX family protein n=1 Tax=Sulfurovum indicum TaxID=2779528 RepID=A0A7M1S3G1_9BACT|nr:YfdX family protein [Sulfurovum indicum]QOR61582.1 YfdX family protein [Sulfurovum indicum]
MKKLLLSAITASLLLGTAGIAKEQAAKDATVKEVKEIAISNAKEDARNHQKKLAAEAIESLKFAQRAVIDLEHKDAKKATEDLEKALGKLEVILAAKDAPKLLPVNNLIRVQEFVGTAKDVDITLKRVKKMLDDGKVQEARALMIPLVSEIDITVLSLPLASYPDALKLAAQYVHDNKPEKAKEVLYIALSTFTEVTEIVPIPLLESADLINAASRIAKEDKERALKYLDAASDALDVAEKLGYVSESATTYKMLHEKIKEVQKEIKGKNKAEKLFESLTEKLKEFKSKVISFSEK